MTWYTQTMLVTMTALQQDEIWRILNRVCSFVICAIVLLLLIGAILSVSFKV